MGEYVSIETQRGLANMNLNQAVSNRVFPESMEMLVDVVVQEAKLRSVELVPAEDGFRIRAESSEYAIVIKAISIAENASEALEREYQRHDRAVVRIDQAERRAMSNLRRSAARRGGRSNANVRTKRHTGGRKLRGAA
ncbi:MAG: hypothetical protein ACKVP3_17310 [Hyphomicrobiaceae bacterium]